jgi:carbamoyl-phosphate synthase small subunit
LDGVRQATDERSSGPATLVLADGRVFRGRGFGARATVVGEVVFNTSMSGYQEIVSDPSYAGQLVCLTAVEIGNVGVNAQDDESTAPAAAGLIVRSLSPVASNWRSEATLPEWLVGRGIPGLCEVDTRALTRHLREVGAVMGALTTLDVPVERLLELARAAPTMEGSDLSGTVTTSSAYGWDEASWEAGDVVPPVAAHVVAYDFGIKRNILRRLRDVGIRTTVVPAATPIQDVLALRPDGVFLSNGPGDPAAVTGAIERIRRLLDAEPELPVFGICLGHQLLCLALGGRTYKLKFGHHGGNHPVRTQDEGRVAITAQNHGFAVELDSLGAGVELTHINLFDGTVAGLRLRDRPVSGVQYHPEASPGPHDSHDSFLRFAAQIRRHAGRAAE